MLLLGTGRVVRSLSPRYSFYALCHRTMSFHFGSTEYAACFNNLPTPDPAKLRENALAYLESFDSQLWYDSPVSDQPARTMWAG